MHFRNNLFPSVDLTVVHQKLKHFRCLSWALTVCQQIKLSCPHDDTSIRRDCVQYRLSVQTRTETSHWTPWGNNYRATVRAIEPFQGKRVENLFLTRSNTGWIQLCVHFTCWKQEYRQKQLFKQSNCCYQKSSCHIRYLDKSLKAH